MFMSMLLTYIYIMYTKLLLIGYFLKLVLYAVNFYHKNLLVKTQNILSSYIATNSMHYLDGP